MPKDSTGTTADLAATQLQPAASAGTRQIVHVTLIYDGVAPSGATLYSALQTAYGSTKVFSEKDTASRGTYVFHVTP